MSAASDIPTTSSVTTGKIPRIVLSILICGWLFLVVLGPLSNPIPSANLTGPLAQRLRPLHQLFFLGHGYRFFGPDPGPSHLLQYQITADDGASELIGRFPDRDVYWPRLMYHRWFMLSETVHQECANLPTLAEQSQMMKDMNSEIERLRLQGELPAMRALVEERNNSEQGLKLARSRSTRLLHGIARCLLEKNGGNSIELLLLERLIPRPVDVQSRVELADPRFLSKPRSLGRFSLHELESSDTSAAGRTTR